MNNYIDFSNPLLFGLISIIITFFICYIDAMIENKKLEKLSKNNNKDYPKYKMSLKLPFIIGLFVWIIARYYKNLINEVNFNIYINSATSNFD